MNSADDQMANQNSPHRVTEPGDEHTAASSEATAMGAESLSGPPDPVAPTDAAPALSEEPVVAPETVTAPTAEPIAARAPSPVAPEPTADPVESPTVVSPETVSAPTAEPIAAQAPSPVAPEPTAAESTPVVATESGPNPVSTGAETSATFTHTPTAPVIGQSAAAPDIARAAPGPMPTPSTPPPTLGIAGTPASAPQIDGFRSGEIVEGTVTAVTDIEVTLELSTGRAAVISSRHFALEGNTDPTAIVAIGDRLEGAVLVREDRENRIVLSRTWALKLRAWAAIDEARSNDSALEGSVTEVIKGGVIVDIGMRAFLPASQLDLRHVNDMSSFVGQTVTVKVTEIDRDRDKVVVSRRAWLKHVEKEAARQLLTELEVGQVRSGRISGLTDFGAFVDLGGIRGLLHVSEMSWQRTSDPSKVVKPGQQVQVKIIGVKKGGKRISLSMRALEPDPMKAIKVGDVMYGTVTRLADFGAFVSIGEGAEGLVHISELSEYRIEMPEEVAMPGDQVFVKVIGVDRKKHRIDLSVTQAMAASLDPGFVPPEPPVAAPAAVLEPESAPAEPSNEAAPAVPDRQEPDQQLLEHNGHNAPDAVASDLVDAEVANTPDSESPDSDNPD